MGFDEVGDLGWRREVVGDRAVVDADGEFGGRGLVEEEEGVEEEEDGVLED